ncbi:MAG: VWA domain-containing protein, partial [Gemmatimonadota bacterium]|nr:VWA domain-containing protein [Gemmatimonadota bacterium]
GALRPGGNGSEASNSRELAPVRVEIRVAGGEGFLDAFSPTHGLNQERDRDDLLVRLTETAPTGPVSIFLPRRERLAGVTVVAHRPAGDDGYALLSLTPPAVGGASQPRDVVVVTDVSGSMSGAKMEQARAAILRVLDGLGSADRFRLISFSNAVTPADEGWVEATPDGRARARSWVNRLRADGGTNIDGALTEAFRLRPGRGRLPVVLFLTDGLPSVGEQDPRRLADAAASRRGDFRVFAFGVGHDVNTRLLDGLSAATRGSTQYVQPGENVERAVSLLAQQISHPVLTDLRIEGSPVRLTEIYPVDIPDLFSGENLVLLARYAADGRGSVTFTGSRGESRVRVTADAEFPRREDRNDYLPRLWAARKLGHLTRQLWLEGESPALVEEIRSTALRYGLPSPFTSILVQEPQALDVVVGTRSPAPAAVRREAERRVMSAAEQATGAGAVGMAESARDFRSAARADQLDELSAPSVSAGGRSRILAGRVFVAQDGVWKDVEADAGSPLVSVRRYSRAWFQVVAALPELEDVARAGDDFEVGGKGMRLRFDDAGEETLDERALSRIVRAFR